MNFSKHFVGDSVDLSQQQLEDLISTEDENLVRNSSISHFQAQAYILHANSVTEASFSDKVYLHGFMGIREVLE